MTATTHPHSARYEGVVDLDRYPIDEPGSARHHA